MLFKMRSAHSVAVLSAVMTVAAVAAAKYKVADPEVKVHATAPLGISFDGTTKKLEITEDEKTITFKTYLNGIDTGIGLRNEHMLRRMGKVIKRDAQGNPVRDDKKKLEMVDHFDVKLSVPNKIDEKGCTDKDKPCTLPGTLSFHKVSVPTKVAYWFEGNTAHATFGLNVHNHFPIPEGLTEDEKKEFAELKKDVLCNKGICAKPEVQVAVKFKFK